MHWNKLTYNSFWDQSESEVFLNKVDFVMQNLLLHQQLSSYLIFDNFDIEFYIEFNIEKSDNDKWR